MPPVGFEPTISAGERPQAAPLLRSWVRIPSGAWIFVCCECRVLSGRGLCDELITRPEEPYRLWCVVVCDLETSRMGAPYIYIYIYIYDISSLRVKVDVPFFSTFQFCLKWNACKTYGQFTCILWHKSLYSRFSICLFYYVLWPSALFSNTMTFYLTAVTSHFLLALWTYKSSTCGEQCVVTYNALLRTEGKHFRRPQ